MATIETGRTGREPRRWRTAALVGAGVASLAAVAAAAAPGATPPTIKAARSAALNRTVVVSASGRTLYRRAGETSTHFLCGTVCARVWPPLMVASASTPLVKGPGITGTLGKARRPDGRWQVTLRGYPIYRFAGDHAPGDAKGQGVAGIWSAVPATTAAVHPPGMSPGPLY